VPSGDASTVTRALRPASGLGASPALVGTLAALAWLAFSIGLRPLTLPEEGRYVGIAWEMLRSGNWLIPTEDGLPFFHKPPLFYWLTAASMQLFGANGGAARLAPLVGAVVGGVALYRVARRWAGESVARWAVLVLVTLPFFFGGAQFANLDMLVAGFMAVAVVLAGHAALLVRNGEPHRAALVGAWAAAALGVLAKGLIGVVLPGLVVVVWLLATRQARTLRSLLSPVGPATFLLITAPWFVAVQMQYPGFFHYFFVYQHFERFAASGFNNVQPWWFFFAAVPALTLPWSLWLFRSTLMARPGEAASATLWRQLMWAWLIVVLLFFSIPQSKPVGYSMAVLFPLAVLIADAVAARLREGIAGARPLALASAAVAVAICLFAVAYSSATYDRDNTAIARTLARLRAPGDRVVFVKEYFFDIPLHARLADPVPVIGDWSDPAFAQRDNWRRELAEAAPFAPALAATLLVDAGHGFALRCGAPLWVLVKSGDEAPVAALPGAVRVEVSNRVALWRVAAADCAKAASP
jgi:4-amino-4-deoxy-L-arabinose transferase-like glycosyltransferase